jgi:hypothetical protein
MREYAVLRALSLPPQGQAGAIAITPLSQVFRRGELAHA